MEELIRWIIIIAVAYSFLKGLFPKKKPETKDTPSTSRMPNKGTYSTGTTVPQKAKRWDEVTLEDILTGKIPVEKQPEPKPQTQMKDAETYSSYDKYSENNPFDSPVDYDQGKSVSRETLIASRLKEKAPENKKKKRELSEKVLMFKPEEMQTAKESELVISLRNKLKQPESLREMFIISEILGKPKVYRKW